MDNESIFKKGDTVRLKSGGPLMTVAESEGSEILCIWFYDNQQKQYRFPSETLQQSQRPQAVLGSNKPSLRSY